jgi:hypothetical protein
MKYLALAVMLIVPNFASASNLTYRVNQLRSKVRSVRVLPKVLEKRKASCTNPSCKCTDCQCGPNCKCE